MIKLYGQEPSPKGRYWPAVCIGSTMKTISGEPDPEHVSTSYIERQNLTMRQELVGLLDAAERVPRKRGKYHKRTPDRDGR